MCRPAGRRGRARRRAGDRRAGRGVHPGRGRRATQHWRWISVGNGYYEIRAQHSNKCLDVANASTAHGASVVQGDCWGGTNQHWRFVNLGNGFYEIRARHSDRCLDVANGSIAHGAYVVQGTCWGGTNQQWRLAYAGTWG
ncbi:RICIN domain-containing protein [Micromonospora sp. NPDC092111]|uniref:RICIN domain-containing protein n=1 Tax=Micromonospora sp. NPDC092111 TaxID=3364289 RepID=UPI00382E838B